MINTKTKNKEKHFRKKHSRRRRMRFCSSCIYGCRYGPKLGKDGNVNRRPNLDRQKAKNWRRNVYDPWNGRFCITLENCNFILNRI